MNEHLPLWAQVNPPISDKNVRDRNEAMGNMIIAYAMGYRYALEHRDEIVKYMSRDRAQAELGHKLDVEQRLVDPDMDVSTKQIDWMQAMNVRLGTQKAVMPLDKLATRQFHERVIKTLGPYQWK